MILAPRGGRKRIGTVSTLDDGRRQGIVTLRGKLHAMAATVRKRVSGFVARG
jgi:hypothetical protein